MDFQLKLRLMALHLNCIVHGAAIPPLPVALPTSDLLLARGGGGIEVERRFRAVVEGREVENHIAAHVIGQDRESY